MPTPSGTGYIDYLLLADDGKPLAIIQAKKTTVDLSIGRYQAKLYADCIEKDNKYPQIAISVDMLDTGIDIPSCLNLVFFKKVMSKTKF